MYDGTGRFIYNGIDEIGVTTFRKVNIFGHYTSPYRTVIYYFTTPTHAVPSLSSRTFTRGITRTLRVSLTKQPRIITRTRTVLVHGTPILKKSITRVYTRTLSVIPSYSKVLTLYRVASAHITIFKNMTLTRPAYNVSVKISTLMKRGAFILFGAATKILYNNGRDVK